MLEERQLVPVTDNSIQDVVNTIDNYQYGSIRALAQDPPQNSFDARHQGQQVRVSYQLLLRVDAKGNIVRLLTVTDTGTTGLNGPVLSEMELDQRTHREGRLVIDQGENWAAFEAMRYTKTGEDKLGSRGQGKYAYLFHSAHPPPGAGSDLPINAQWMVILYDTLLTEGEYRFGGRFHNPSARRIEPPFIDDEARQVIRTSYSNDNLDIPLKLDPLSEPGTRVIIPFLSDEAYEAINNGELVYWLESIWWRKIQKNELSIEVIDETELTRQIIVPRYWQGETWRSDESYYMRENIPLPHYDNRWYIKRIVLISDSTLDASDELDGLPQRNGIQLLRQGQWIETLSMDILADSVPLEYRSGFRGFVEFDRKLEHELREIENPAHDGFNRRMGLYRDIVAIVKHHVRKYALENEWIEDPDIIINPQHDKLVEEYTRLFVDITPNGPVPSQVEWECIIYIDYPREYAQANWGESLSVEAICYRRPILDGRMVSFNATLVRPDGSEVEIFTTRSQRLQSSHEYDWSSASVNFGSLSVLHPGEWNSKFTSAGRHSIKVDCWIDDQKMATGRRFFYVSQTPPRPSRDITLELMAYNSENKSNVIPQGGCLQWRATVRNYQGLSMKCELDVTIEDEPHILYRGKANLQGVMLGDQPSNFSVEGRLTIMIEGDQLGANVLRLADGEYKVIASVTKEDQVLASAVKVIHVGNPPDEEDGNLPFRMTADESGSIRARWRLDDPATDRMYTLLWTTANPVYQALPMSAKAKGTRLSPREQYISEIIAEALVDWALREYQRQGDEGRLRLISSSALSLDTELGGRFETFVEQLKSVADHPSGYSEVQRELAAIMVEIVRRVKD